jgi:hypothetical protein
MKTISKLGIAAMTVTAALAAGNANAGEVGWFDSVVAGWTDSANGWVCMNEDPTNTPMYGSLDVYLDGPKETGYYYGNFKLNQGGWGSQKDGVNQAGYCGTDSYVGFSLSGWFTDDQSTGPTKVYVYWRNNMGYQTMLPGSPITITSVGSNISSSDDQNAEQPTLMWRNDAAHPYLK